MKFIGTRLTLLALVALTGTMAWTTAASAHARAYGSFLKNSAYARAATPGCVSAQLTETRGFPAATANASATCATARGVASASASASRRRVTVIASVSGTGSAGKLNGTEVSVSGASDTLIIDSSVSATRDTLRLTGRLTALSNYATDTANNLLTVAVYPDSATAGADSAGTGTGALFFGKLTVATTANPASSSVVASGGLSNADFVVTNGSDGTLTVTPVANLQKIVTISDSSKVAVSAAADPAANEPLPGVSPFGITMIAMLLLVGGTAALWMRKRASAA